MVDIFLIGLLVGTRKHRFVLSDHYRQSSSTAFFGWADDNLRFFPPAPVRFWPELIRTQCPVDQGENRVRVCVCVRFVCVFVCVLCVGFGFFRRRTTRVLLFGGLELVFPCDVVTRVCVGALD